MHCLRGCKLIAELWSKFIAKECWSKFFSIGSNHWLKTNLFTDDCGQGHRHWPTAFGIIVHSIWSNRNQMVFASGQSEPEAFRMKNTDQIDFVHHEILNPVANYVEASKHLLHIRWIPPPQNAYKLNTDGSHRMDT